jgi:hypothetical protein
MKVFILKEGKEYNQGVAYLDDGTMVVVDNARKMISKTIDVVVTSVLQTTAGKMIFGRYIESMSSPAAQNPSGQATAAGGGGATANPSAAHAGPVAAGQGTTPVVSAQHSTTPVAAGTDKDGRARQVPQA